jgi:site-specific recombinase XerD
MSTISYWKQLKGDFIAFLEEKGYEKTTFAHYKSTIDLLIRYANAHEHELYNSEIGNAFLESEERLAYLQSDSIRFRRTVIRRFNEYLDGEKYSFKYLRVAYECPQEYLPEYEAFLQSLRKEGLKDSTISQYHVFCVKLFQDFIKSGISSWDMVNAKAVADAFTRSTNKGQFRSYTKRLFRFLVDDGKIKYDYSGILPKVQLLKSIPSVYTTSEVDTILGSVDRSTAVGKRDYAVLLLAVRLGLRAMDIRLLRFDNIHFDRKAIEFTQYKTGVAQRLTLLPEIEAALIDYIDNGREQSDEPHIFLSYRKKPLQYTSPIRIAEKYFRKSGVDWGDRHHGIHSLRMTLASGLVEENVPFEVVSKVLGHEDPNALSHYVKFATESLRSCALEVPAPGGQFLEYLTCGGGGQV